MPSRAEPFLSERLWAHPRNVQEDVATTYFEDGRPVRTEYLEAEPETYEYDATGRLVVINESERLWWTGDGERFDTGGRLELEYDERGVVRIGDAWQRLDEPYEDLFERGVADLEQGILQALAEHGEAGTRAYALSVVYTDQGSLIPVIELGRDEDRPFDELYELLYPESLGYADVEAVDEDLARLLLMHTAIAQPENPYRLVLGEVCRRLARRGWDGLIVPTDDFVVFCAEHDEDVGPKIEMIRAVNPVERVAAWERVFAALSEEDDF